MIVLGALLAAADARAPIGLGMANTAQFGLVRGMAHGAEAPAGAGFGFPLGFAAATALLHLKGLGVGIGLTQLKHQRCQATHMPGATRQALSEQMRRPVSWRVYGGAVAPPRKPKTPFYRFNASPEIIRLVVMMYVKFPLSLRNVEDLLHERALPGTYRMQPRVLHLLRRLGAEPRQTPSSNVVFVRSRREADLAAEKHALLDLSWPVHQAVIDRLGIRAVLCFGQTARLWARERLDAHEPAGAFVDQNSRAWKSCAHANSVGQIVFSLPHPSIAAWNVAATGPCAFVIQAMARLITPAHPT